MKILVLSEWFSDKMGYAENYLPKAFGKLGHEVHLVTTDLQVYATSPEYEKIYQHHLGPKLAEQGVFNKEYYTLHRNPHTLTGGLKILNLENKIRELQPDIVYCFEIFNGDTKRACILKSKYNYKLFCESRMHLSIYRPPKSVLKKIIHFRKKIIGKMMSAKIDKFYPIAPDVLHVITTYCGIPQKKCKISSLAVDTDLFFRSVQLEEVKAFRKKNGYDDDDIVCLYTGRFAESKGPLILAQAVNYLQERGHAKFKGLFVGQGEKEYQNIIKNAKGCTIHPFVEVNQLPIFYNSFDIGVWPLQESTSQLDAAACGMPIIINEKVEDTLRTEGNGLRYRDRDVKDLADKILLLQDKVKRNEMGKIGSEKIANFYSWDYLAKNKITDFNHHLNMK
jgi:glycosyltransferase involved in cell wall biosynthesis